MKCSVQHYINSIETDLVNIRKSLSEIENGTFEYDDSMPKSCVDAMYLHKLKITLETLEYLNSLPNKDKIISTSISFTEEGSKYYELICR